MSEHLVATTPTHDLVDLSAVLGITACTKRQDVASGNYFVLLDLEMAPRSLDPSSDSHAPVASTTTQLELTLPQFYHLLAEMEELKAHAATARL
jgi:hypothetical protein